MQHLIGCSARGTGIDIANNAGPRNLQIIRRQAATPLTIQVSHA